MTRNQLAFVAVALVAAACDPKDSGEDQNAPTRCIPSDLEYEDPVLDRCNAYFDVHVCCFPPDPPSDGLDWGGRCALSSKELNNGSPAPAECPMLMMPALQCAIDVAGRSCAEFSRFHTGIRSFEPREGGGPPTDTTMPCYAEITALWDAGCEPYMW